MTQRRILILGDSHTHALKRAIGARRAPSEFAFEAFRFRKAKGDKEIGDLSVEAALEKVAELAPDDILLSTIGGNQHSTFGLVQHPIPFDFFSLDDADDEPAGQVQCIPSAIIAEFFEEGLARGDGKRIKQLRAVAQCPVYHAAPPPPKSDDRHILASHETAFAQLGILDKGVSPPSLRLKLWKLQVEKMRRICKKIGVKQVAPPNKARDSEGFLAADYYARDATHANEAYGELVLRQIEKFARTRHENREDA